MSKKNKKNPKRRSAAALVALCRKAGPMRSKRRQKQRQKSELRKEIAEALS